MHPNCSRGSSIDHFPPFFHLKYYHKKNQDHARIEDSQTKNSFEGMTPKVGMKFNSEQEAYDFYNAYAHDMGFSIGRRSYHYVGNSTIIKNRTFCCSREGIG